MPGELLDKWLNRFMDPDLKGDDLFYEKDRMYECGHL